MTLTEFLLARIAEDEYAARAEIGRLDVVLVGAFAPARVLVECEAKRRIVNMHQAEECEGVTVCRECGPEEDIAFRVDAYGRGFPCDTLRALAAVYSDHPDCDDEWRP